MGRAGQGWAVAGWRCLAKLWRDLSGEVGRALARSDVHAKHICTGTGMCLQPAPCFSKRTNTSLQLEKQKGGGFSARMDARCREGDPGLDLCQPASEPPAPNPFPS